MQALAHKGSARVQPFTPSSARPARVRVVQCQAAQQQNSQLQQVAAAAVIAASCLCVPAAHAATELMQPGVDVATAVGSGAAVAGLGALLVATDPQKRCVRAYYTYKHTPITACCCGRMINCMPSGKALKQIEAWCDPYSERSVQTFDHGPLCVVCLQAR